MNSALHVITYKPHLLRFFYFVEMERWLQGDTEFIKCRRDTASQLLLESIHTANNRSLRGAVQSQKCTQQRWEHLLSPRSKKLRWESWRPLGKR